MCGAVSVFLYCGHSFFHNQKKQKADRRGNSADKGNCQDKYSEKIIIEGHSRAQSDERAVGVQGNRVDNKP